MERLTLLKTFLNIKEILPIRWSERRGNFGRLDHFVKFPNMATAALDYVNNLSFEGETWKDTFDEELKELINFPNGKTFRPTYGKVRPTQSDIEQEKTRIITAISQFVVQVRTCLNMADMRVNNNSNSIPTKPSKSPIKKTSKKRGAHKTEFRNCIKNDIDKDAFLKVLHNFLDGGNFDVNTIIKSCIGNYLKYEPTAASIQDEFGINQRVITADRRKYTKDEKYYDSAEMNNYLTQIDKEYNELINNKS